MSPSPCVWPTPAGNVATWTTVSTTTVEKAQGELDGAGVQPCCRSNARERTFWRAAATDIRCCSEGTICPISFVKDVLVSAVISVISLLATRFSPLYSQYDHKDHHPLVKISTVYVCVKKRRRRVSQACQFPYALKALPDVLAQKWDHPEFEPYRNAFPPEYRTSPEQFKAHVEDLTARDVKIAYLKNLQGKSVPCDTPTFPRARCWSCEMANNIRHNSNLCYLWQSGYESHAYATPLYSDVAPHLELWRSTGFDLAIYSSGSVFAQKLLFQYVQKSRDTSETIDPRPLISAWFDTTNAGPKTEMGSYRVIATALGLRYEEVLFLSDNVKEIDAAHEANIPAIVVHREGNPPLPANARDRYTVVTSLAEIEIGGSKSAKIDDRFWK
ncbi:enolase-phosphatase E1, partial [Cryomyces antarcticus]